MYSPRLPKYYPTTSDAVSSNRPLVSATKGIPGDELDGFISSGIAPLCHSRPPVSRIAPSSGRQRPSSASSSRSAPSLPIQMRGSGVLKTDLQLRQEGITAPRKTLMIRGGNRAENSKQNAYVKVPQPPTSSALSARPPSARVSRAQVDVGATSSYRRRSSYEASCGLHIDRPDDLKMTLDRHEYFHAHRLAHSCLPVEPTLYPMRAIEDTERELYRESVTKQNGRVLLLNLDYKSAFKLNNRRKEEGIEVVAPITSVDCNSADLAVSKVAPGTTDVALGRKPFPASLTFIRFRYPEVQFRSHLMKWLMGTVELMDHPYIKTLRDKFWTCSIPLSPSVAGDADSDPILYLKRIWAKHADRDIGLGMPYSNDSFELFTIEAVTGEKDHKYSKRYQEKLTTFMMGDRKVVRAIPDDVLAAAMASKPYLDQKDIDSFFQGLGESAHARMNYDLVFLRLHMLLACGTPALQPALTRLFLSQAFRKVQSRRSCSAQDFYMTISLLESFLRKGSAVPASSIHSDGKWHTVYHSGCHVPEKESLSTSAIPSRSPRTTRGTTSFAPPLQKLEEIRQEVQYSKRLKAARTKQVVVQVTTKPAALQRVAVMDSSQLSSSSSNTSETAFKGGDRPPELPHRDMCYITPSIDDTAAAAVNWHTIKDDVTEIDEDEKKLMHLIYGEVVETLASPVVDDDAEDSEHHRLNLDFTRQKAVSPEVAQLIVTFRKEVDYFAQQLPTESFEVQVDQAWRMFPRGSLLLSYLTSGLDQDVKRALAKEAAALFHGGERRGPDDDDLEASMIGGPPNRL